MSTFITTPVAGPSNETHAAYIIVIIILILLVIGLAIWLIVDRSRDDNSSDQEIKGIPNATVKFGSDEITGTWGTLQSEDDKVTMCVSRKILTTDSAGNIMSDINGQVTCNSDTGSGKSVTVSNLEPGIIYYVSMIATSLDRNICYRESNFQGPTQTQKDLGRKLFNVSTVNQKGIVSKDAKYTTNTKDAGNFVHTTTNRFLRHTEENDDLTDEDFNLLCADDGKLVMARRHGSEEGKPITVPVQHSASFPEGLKDIPESNCGWCYNTNGNGKWDLCFVELNEGIRGMQYNGNGTVINVSQNATDTDNWIQTFTGLLSSNVS